MIEKIRIENRSQWLALRKQDLTASDLAAVAGIDPYKSALSVFAEKSGRITTQETPAMRRGRWLEGAAAFAFAEQHPDWPVEDPQIYLRDPEVRLGATPDRVTEDPETPGLVNIQIKTISRPSFEKWQGVPPLGYQLQTICESMLMDARTAFLAVLVISTYEADLVLFEVPRHPGAEIRIRQLARDFWTDMDAGRMPKPDFSRDDETISALYSMPKPEPVLDLSSSNRIREILEERAILKARIKADETIVAALDTEMKYTLGESESAVLPGWRLSWKNQTREAKWMPEKTTRVLRVTQDAAEREEAA